MPSNFPTVGLFAESALLRMLKAPALALGIDIVDLSKDSNSEIIGKCEVISVFDDFITASQVKSLEVSGHTFRPTSNAMECVGRLNQTLKRDEHIEEVFSVSVARSPHDQGAAWAPTQIYIEDSGPLAITPAPSLSSRDVATVQKLALDLARDSGAVGVVEVEVVRAQDAFHIHRASLGPSSSGTWTIDGARTSQFEQHLRAILDLPLGDPALLAPCVVSAPFAGEGNMFRPYLHLMARSPRLKFYQYRSGPGAVKGHVTTMGRDLLDLRECVTHAVEYMSGVINE